MASRLSVFAGKKAKREGSGQSSGGEEDASKSGPKSPITTSAKSPISTPAKNPITDEPQVIRDFREQLKREKGSFITPGTLKALVDAIANKEAIDDRQYLLEHALTFVARLDDGAIKSAIETKIVELLYNDLSHPPATSIGEKYQFRAADGAYNNPDLPDMGKAGTPYARSVQQGHPLPKNRLPDPGLIFDVLLKRDGFKEHPAGLSSLMFSFAALVIHTVFRTSHVDVNINETSSYVDLSPLYGHNQEEQDRIRLRDGRGLLYPDNFAEDRLLLLPPAVCSLLVLFSRNHNYIANRLLEINERGTWNANIASLDKEALIKQEEEIFQTARLVNCGWFGSVVFSDYFSCILGLVRDGSNWSLDPFHEIRNEDHSVFERGKGNVCSVEFNCLYRWHATTSQHDEEWVAQTFAQYFDNKDPEECTLEDFKGAAHKIAAQRPDIHHWTFGGMSRTEEGGFKDEDLAKIIQDATERPAGAFRARGTPACMRLHEIMGIEQNRRWGVCSLNDFRGYLGLKRYTTFKEWNPDPEISEAAERLYGHIDSLELYVGLQAEQAKPVMDGAGLCPGFTISRAILSDAIALTRGDRHFTHDYTPYNLTSWGFADCQRDPGAYGFGSTLGRLLLRTLPNHFNERSVYTYFPLMTPQSMKTHLTKLKILDQYDLERPKAVTPIVDVKEYSQVAEVVKTPASFEAPYAKRAARVIPGKGYYTVESAETQEKVWKALASTPDEISNITNDFYDLAKVLIEKRSYGLVGKKTRGVDIVRDVTKVAPAMWAASDLAGIPLKTKENTYGDYTPEELYDILTEIYSFIFLEIEPSKNMVLGQKVVTNVKNLLAKIKGNLHNEGKERKGSIAAFIGNVSTILRKQTKDERDQLQIIKRLGNLGGSSDELANTVLALMVGTTVELSLALTNVINLLVGPENNATLSAQLADAKSGNIDAYIYEALRIDPPVQGVYRTATKDVKVGDVPVAAGQRVFADIAAANTSETLFPSPLAINAQRDRKQTIFSDGAFSHFGETLTVKIISEVLRAIYEHKNLRRAPGQSGVLARFKNEARPDLRHCYLDSTMFSTAAPYSLTLLYDSA